MSFATTDNTVELVLTAGGDLAHAAAAWTCTAREVTEDRYPEIPRLLMQLADRAPLDLSPIHSSPFEHSMLSFNVEEDVATRIQQLRHRIGVSPNEESARWRELEDRAYIPKDWPPEWQARLASKTEEMFALYHEATADLTTHFMEQRLTPRQAKTRAKETARYFLPHSIRVRTRVTFNFMSFMHFIRLRNDDHAQLEIHEVAAEMLRQVRAHGGFTYSLIAFGWDGPDGTPNRRVRTAEAQANMLVCAREAVVAWRALYFEERHGGDLSDLRVLSTAHEAAASRLFAAIEAADAAAIVRYPEGHTSVHPVALLQKRETR